jgi:hypothetical protein
MPYKDKEKAREYAKALRSMPEQKENQRQYREANKELLKAKAITRNSTQEVVARKKQYMSGYYDANKEHLCAKTAERNSREEVKQKAKEYEKTSERKDKKSAWHKENWIKNKELLTAKNKQWHNENMDKVCARRKERYSSDVAFKIKVLLRTRLNLAIKNRSKKGSAVSLLGCSINEFILYFEEKFKVGMDWSNWGEWHIDHIIPLALFDLGSIEQLQKACHYSNLQPLWAVENLGKGAR